MSEFKNVTIIKAANIYYEGKVTSRTVLFGDGTKKTVSMNGKNVSLHCTGRGAW